MMNIFLLQKKMLKTSSVLFLLCLSMFYFVYADDGAGIMDITEHKHVLIVNSYHQGLAWTKDESDGIIDTLSQSGANLSIYVEYMDWKDIPTEENMEHFYEYMKYKYQGKNIDVIIATDDSALSFALNNRAELFSNAPVVFCGVNQQGAAELTRGGSNYTGVIEEIDPTETVKMALSINPSLRNIYILFDNSESGVSTGEIVIEKIEGMKLNPIPLNKLTYEQLIRDVKSYDENSIILVTTYFSDVDGRIVEFDNVSREIGKNSSVPVYHLYEMGLDNGAFGGVMMSGRLQGENAAGLALRILGGEAADDIPVISPVTTRKVFDFQQLERFSVSIKDIPQDSEVLNKPFSFFGTYKAIVLSVLAVFIILLAFVFSLLYYISKIREMKRILSLNHEELSETYE
ncbi:MAG: ABC transporter substrate binding protein [Clostridiaceae bacterium]|nr:ABC transporter substrate binding protein [Clostridiaceae bacterium]